MSTPLSDFVGMKHWNDEKQRWHAVIVRVERKDDGGEQVVVYDADFAETQVGIDDWIRDTLAKRPWEKHK